MIQATTVAISISTSRFWPTIPACHDDTYFQDTRAWLCYGGVIEVDEAAAP
jgi:hypothetical protein